MNTYTDDRRLDCVSAIENLPDLDAGPQSDTAELRAAVTDDVVPPPVVPDVVLTDLGGRGREATQENGVAGQSAVNGVNVGSCRGAAGV